MNPVLHARVFHAFVERVGRQHQYEVACALHTLNELVLKFARLQLLDVYEHAEPSHLEVHLQKTVGGARPTAETDNMITDAPQASQPITIAVKIGLTVLYAPVK